MGDTLDSRYWCHMCSQIVNPVMEIEIKCPFCQSGFVEEMDGGGDHEGDLRSGRGSLSLWAPILLRMISNPSRHRRYNRDEEDQETPWPHEHYRDSESALLRRRRSSAAILELLQGLRTELNSESLEAERDREVGGDRERGHERVILINPFNQAMILEGSFDLNQQQNQTDRTAGISMGDYIIGPGLDLLLQHLAENDPNRYGTAPAQKEAVEALPTVNVSENLQCSVCLEDFEMGSEAKEMPCKHKFHPQCILPWLELHCSCPVCRFQIPSEESMNGSGSGNGNNIVVGTVDGVIGGDRIERDGTRGANGSGRRFWTPVSWPFNGLFSLSGGSQGSGDSSSALPSSSSAPTSRMSRRNDDN